MCCGVVLQQAMANEFRVLLIFLTKKITETEKNDGEIWHETSNTDDNEPWRTCTMHTRLFGVLWQNSPKCVKGWQQPNAPGSRLWTRARGSAASLQETEYITWIAIVRFIIAIDGRVLYIFISYIPLRCVELLEAFCYCVCRLEN